MLYSTSAEGLFYNEEASRSCSTGAVAFYTHVWAMKRWKRARGIANLIQELLRGAQNYSFGVSLTIEAAKIEIL